MKPNPYPKKVCDCCQRELFVSFTRKDGRPSIVKRWARGAVQLAFVVKKATHSDQYDTAHFAFCVECAGDQLLVVLPDLLKRLMSPTGAEPPRKPIVRKKRGPRPCAVTTLLLTAGRRQTLYCTERMGHVGLHQQAFGGTTFVWANGEHAVSAAQRSRADFIPPIPSIPPITGGIFGVVPPGHPDDGQLGTPGARR
ncbi:MAG: hypothetical protein KA310_03560 [Pseudomonadales bacterium]|nr:hypothetical protein [Pseudomonadales bacterium]